MRDTIPLGEIDKLVTARQPTIVELGAHHGWHTLAFLRLFPAARIYCCEPDPRCIKQFRNLVRSPRVTLYAAAIGASDGHAAFHPSGGPGIPGANYGKPQGWDFSGSIRRPKAHTEIYPEITFGEPITVPLMTLDRWFETVAVEAIDFLWADLQGAEQDMIAGGRTALAHTRYAYLEYSNRELYEGQLDLDGLLALLPGFEVVEVFKHDVLLRNASLA